PSSSYPVAAVASDRSCHCGSAVTFPTAHTRWAPYTPATCRAGAPATRWSAALLLHSHCCSPRLHARAPHRPPAASHQAGLRAPSPLPAALLHAPATLLRSPLVQYGILES